MKIEFKLGYIDHRESFEVLTNMLGMLDRETVLNDTVCALIDADEEFLQDVIEEHYILDGYQVFFQYIKCSGKITLSSRKVQ